MEWLNTKQSKFCNILKSDLQDLLLEELCFYKLCYTKENVIENKHTHTCMCIPSVQYGAIVQASNIFFKIQQTHFGRKQTYALHELNFSLEL